MGDIMTLHPRHKIYGYISGETAYLRDGYFTSGIVTTTLSATTVTAGNIMTSGDYATHSDVSGVILTREISGVVLTRAMSGVEIGYQVSGSYQTSGAYYQSGDTVYFTNIGDATSGQYMQYDGSIIVGAAGGGTGYESGDDIYATTTYLDSGGYVLANKITSSGQMTIHAESGIFFSSVLIAAEMRIGTLLSGQFAFFDGHGIVGRYINFG